jgi:hypothetical protein
MGSEIYYGGIHMGDANGEKYGSFFLVEYDKGTLLCETRMECGEDCYVVK